MNLKLVKLQAFVCVLISLFLFAELGYGEFAARRLQNKLQYTAGNDEAPAQLPTIAAAKPSADADAEMVDRPLFIEGRKPLAEVDLTAKAQNVETSQIEDWVLNGVYNKDKSQFALFAKKNEAKKYQKISVGQQISGWLLKEIQPDRVILEQAGQQKSLMLRKPRPEGKTPGRAKPAAPVPVAPPAQPNDNNPEDGNDDSETN